MRNASAALSHSVKQEIFCFITVTQCYIINNNCLPIKEDIRLILF